MELSDNFSNIAIILLNTYNYYPESTKNTMTLRKAVLGRNEKGVLIVYLEKKLWERRVFFY